MIHLLANALAQTAGDLPIDVERFRPAADTYGYITTESASTLGHLQLGVGLWGNHSRDSLVLSRNGQRVIGPAPDFPNGLIDERSMVDAQFGFGLFNRVALLIDLPIVLWQQGFEPGAPGTLLPAQDLYASGVGDLRITPKIVLLDYRKKLPLSIAASGTITAPLGSRRSFIGEGSITASPLLIVEIADGDVRGREHHVRFAINAGARIKQTDTFRGLDLGPEFLFRAAAGIHPIQAVELGVEAVGSLAGTSQQHVPLEVVPHLRLIPTTDATLVAGAGFGVLPGPGAPDWRVFVGGTLAPRFDPLSRDRDKDGIPNKYDGCIDIPEDKDGFEDADGCPEPDNDQDGNPDTTDRCPNEPEDYDQFEDPDGCPDPDNDRDRIPDVSDRCPMQPEDYDGFGDLDGCPEPDNDLDGLPDPVDRCPNVPENFNGFEDTDGCPDQQPVVDTDGDGLPDNVDRCPFDAEDFDGFQDEDGCPEPDNDLDGIYDINDACPFQPETRNGYLDEDGCPDDAPTRVVLERTRINILEKVFFEVDQAVIQQVSYSLLDEVAAVIVDHPSLRRIRVEGHTDSDGGDAYNERLSHRRAEAVATYLVNRGVEPGRLEFVGFGEARPIDSNKTAEGKQNNRRVEFVILEQE